METDALSIVHNKQAQTHRLKIYLEREHNHKTETSLKLDVRPSLNLGWTF